MYYQISYYHGPLELNPTEEFLETEENTLQLSSTRGWKTWVLIHQLPAPHCLKAASCIINLINRLAFPAWRLKIGKERVTKGLTHITVIESSIQYWNVIFLQNSFFSPTCFPLLYHWITEYLKVPGFFYLLVQSPNIEHLLCARLWIKCQWRWVITPGYYADPAYKGTWNTEGYIFPNTNNFKNYEWKIKLGYKEMVESWIAQCKHSLL